MKEEIKIAELNLNSEMIQFKLRIEKNVYRSEIKLNKLKYKYKKIEKQLFELRRLNYLIVEKKYNDLYKVYKLELNKLKKMNYEFEIVGKKLASFNLNKKTSTNLEAYRKTNKGYFNLKKQIFQLEQKLIKDKKFLKKLSTVNLVKINLRINRFEEEYNRLKILLKKQQEKVKINQNSLKKITDKFNELRTKRINASSNKEKILVIRNLSVYYGQKPAIQNVNIDIPKNKIISIIGPSGCGKSTFLRTLNRINDEIADFRAKGSIILDGEYDILSLTSIYNLNQKITLPYLRKKIGMVFQHPSPFPTSIYKNVAYGPKINGIKNKTLLNSIVIKSLKKAALYDEIKDNLKILATGLSGGQQQRLCIARALANSPEILLMDEPTSALDPLASAKVEELLLTLKKDYTIILVTHSMQQAARISDKTAFFYQGKLLEFGDTKQIFESPKKKKTEDYIRGRFG